MCSCNLDGVADWPNACKVAFAMAVVAKRC